jgi:hypothetical protein
VFEPAVSPKVAAPNSKRNLVSGIPYCLLDTSSEFRRHALVRIEVKHPLVFEREIREGPVFMLGFVSTEKMVAAARWPQEKVGAGACRYGGRCICAAGIVYVNVI